MAKTFMDVQLECVLYPYSQECLELTRECSEIDLMDTFIRRAEFMQEARELEMEMGSLVTESYFGESTDENELDAVYESVASKIGSVVKKIWKGICKLFRALGKFIGLCGQQTEQQGNVIESILTADPSKVPNYKGTSKPGEYWFYWTRDAYDVINDIVNTYTGGNTATISFKPEQQGGLNIHYEYDPSDKALRKDVAKISNAFRAALAFGGATVTIQPQIQAATFDQAVKLANALKDPKSTTARGNMDALREELQKVTSTSLSKRSGSYNFFQFKVDRGYLDQVSKELSDAATAMEAAASRLASVDQMANEGNKGSEKQREKRGKNVAAFYSDDASNIGGIAANDASKLHEEYGRVNTLVGNTLEVFNSYMNFRKAVLKAYGGKTKVGTTQGANGKNKNVTKSVGTLRDGAPTKEKDIGGKEHLVNGGQKVTKDDIKDGSDDDTKVKQAKAQK